MLRELYDVSAEARMGADLFNSRGDAFHKKITIRQYRRGIHPPRGFSYAGDSGYGSDGERLVDYVASDNVEVPPDIEIISIVEFVENAAIGEPWKASNPPYELYQDVHTHEPANSSMGGIAVKQVKVQ